MVEVVDRLTSMIKQRQSVHLRLLPFWMGRVGSQREAGVSGVFCGAFWWVFAVVAVVVRSARAQTHRLLAGEKVAKLFRRFLRHRLRVRRVWVLPGLGRVK